MKGSRTVTEYRVISTREGGVVSDKRYGSIGAVRDRIGRLTSPEPWRFYGCEADRQKAPDEYVCCAGTRYDECNCGGDTMKSKADSERAQYPPIVSIKVQKRSVTRTAWEDAETPDIPVFVPERDDEEDQVSR